MEYAEAKIIRDRLERAVAVAGANLDAFPKDGPMGLTSDHVKFSPQYLAARVSFDGSFAALRKFNATFTKQFKREITKDRRAAKASS